MPKGKLSTVPGQETLGFHATSKLAFRHFSSPTFLHNLASYSH